MKALAVAGIASTAVLGVGAATYGGTRLALGDGLDKMFSGKIDHAGEVGNIAFATMFGAITGGMFSTPFLGIASNPGTRPMKHAGAIGFAILGAGIVGGAAVGLALNMNQTQR